MLNTGDEVRLQITGLTHDGYGVGRADGLAVFVKGAIPGDVIRASIVSAKKRYALGSLLELLARSADRVDPGCMVYSECGGCQLRHVSYEAQLKHKEDRVRQALSRIGGYRDADIRPCIPADTLEGYRNRVQYAVMHSSGDIAVGFRPKGTHSVTDVEHCRLAPPQANEVASALRHVLKGLAPPAVSLHHSVIRVSGCTDEIMVILLTRDTGDARIPRIASSLKARMPAISSIYHAVSPDGSGTSFDKLRLVLGAEKIRDCLGDLILRLSPKSFTQVNSEQAVKLYDKVKEYACLTLSSAVLDVYCGIGAIALYLAPHCHKVTGIEILDEAIEDAQENAEVNRIGNASFLAGTADALIAELAHRREQYDVIVLDPPRAGCERAVLDCVGRLGPGRVVYVSCDPETLARDLAVLRDYGFCLVQAQPVDMFPMTHHVECVVLMSRLGK